MTAARPATSIGPARAGGRSVGLRPLRLGDAGEWRRIRVRDERWLRPVTATAPRTWIDRHSDRAWAAEWWSARLDARAGRRFAYVIEVDGGFAGQCQLAAIDTRTGTAELGLWLDSTHAGGGVAGTAVALLLDAGFGALALHRVTAPIAVDNTVVTSGAATMGMRHEATLERYFDADGARRDHQLWAVTRPEIPPDGFTALWSRLTHRSTPRTTTPDTPAFRTGKPETLATIRAIPDTDTAGPSILAHGHDTEATRYSHRHATADRAHGHGIWTMPPVTPPSGQPVATQPSALAHRPTRSAQPMVAERSTPPAPTDPPQPTVAERSTLPTPTNSPQPTVAETPTLSRRHTDSAQPMVAERSALPAPTDSPRPTVTETPALSRRPTQSATTESPVPSEQPTDIGQLTPVGSSVALSTVARVILRHTAGSVRRRCRVAIPGPATTLTATPEVTLVGERYYDLASPRGRVFAVVRADAVIGHCRLFGRDMFDRNLSAELVPLTPDFGIDLRQAVLRVLLAHTADLTVVRLTLLVPTTDDPTAAAAEQAGFAFEGTLRDVRDRTGVHGDLAVWAHLTPEPR